MKQCKDCKESLREEEFPPAGNGKYSSRCRPCKRIYDNNWYARNGDPIAKNKKCKAIRVRNRKFLLKYLEDKSCAVCGESDSVVLELDHIDHTKKSFNISDMVMRGYAITSIEKELELCQVLCANCHRRKTAKEFDWYRLTE